MSCLYFVGFQGAGKTVVGRRISKHLSIAFCDLDEHICDHLKVDDIKSGYSLLGEESFRALEKRLFLKLPKTGVISLGGGAVRVLPFFPKKAAVVYLFRPLTELENEMRFFMKQGRVPLWVSREDPISSLHNRWKERHGLYKQAATVVVGTQGKSIDDVKREVIALYG